MITNNQSTQLEEVVSSTVQGLRQLEGLLGYEFAEAIDTIERLYDLQAPKLDIEAKIAEYAKASGKGAAKRIVETNQTSSFTKADMYKAFDRVFNPYHVEEAR